MRTTPVAVTPVSELNEVVVRLGALATAVGAENVSLPELRPALHRIVVAPEIAGAVKTLVVQALLLLDDPRIVDGGRAGAPLVQKIRKLLAAAIDAHAQGGANTPAPAHAAFSPDALVSPDIDRGLVEEFVVEAREQLALAEAALLALDSAPDDMQALDRTFRAIHTIKGTSAFLGVEHVTELAHHAESVLARIRSGTAHCAGEISNVLFRSIDMLDAILVAIDSVAEGDVAMLPDGFRELLTLLRDEPAPATQRESLARVSGSVRAIRIVEPSLRVRCADVDRLSDIVRELLLTHAMLTRDTALRSNANAELSRKIAHAERLVLELEDATNELRTVPFANVVQKLARLARDAAHQNGKSIDFTTQGDDLLIERAAADALGDALVHMVRNAIDHGIEPAEIRERAGKPEIGHVRLTARHADTQLQIELTDDGCGLDAKRLMRKAQERGIISAGVELSEQEAYTLILRPGFTTAAVVTDLSGRGVGMDVVRARVDALGGTLEIASRVGGGTTFTIRVPYRSRPRRTDEDTWGEVPRTIGLIA